MNYIKAMQAELEDRRRRLSQIENELRDFWVYLHSEKFRGVDSAGNRKDWIAVADVVTRTQEIRALCVGFDKEPGQKV